MGYSVPVERSMGISNRDIMDRVMGMQEKTEITCSLNKSTQSMGFFPYPCLDTPGDPYPYP